MAKILDMLFGCWHSNYSFPITSRSTPKTRRPLAAQATGTYVVCLECGKEFAYDWNEMRILSSSAERRYARAALIEGAESYSATEGRAA